MKTKLLVISTLSLVTLVLYEIRTYSRRQKIEWAEGNLNISLIGKRAVYLRTTSDSDPAKLFSQIFVFDTNTYPDLVKRGYPNEYEMNNPRASFLIPVKLYARASQIEIDSQGSRVTIKQGALNQDPPIQYELDLDRFSLVRTE